MPGKEAFLVAQYLQNPDAAIQKDGIKSYYHLLTIANETAGCIRLRCTLLGLIEEAEKQGNAGRASELSKLAFEVENLPQAAEKKQRLMDFVSAYAATRDQMRNTVGIPNSN